MPRYPRRQRARRRYHARNTSNVAVWGVHTWSSDFVWGSHDTNQQATAGDRYSGRAFWGRGYWVTDPWLRWRT